MSRISFFRIVSLAAWLAVLFGISTGTSLRAQSKPYDPELFKALKWRNVGPLRGGRSIAAAGVLARPNEYYFGAVGGGLWKTTDGGATWNPVTDGQIKSSSVGAVAVSDSNPDVIYIGMGEACIRGNIMQGDGVYKSSDAGKTWTHLGLADTQAISRIRIHPTNSDLVYVSAFGHPAGANDERGIYRSKDGGKTWQRILFRNSKTGAIDLALDRNHPNVIYAALWEAYRVAWQMSSGGPSSGLFKSTDGGDTWTEITRNEGLPKGVIGRIGISVSGGDGNRLYALVEAEDGGVFRSDDAGATWARVNDERKLRQRAFYYTHIFADTQNKDTVYALNTGFYKSIDGGKTFKTTIRVPHGDNHDLWIDPTNPQRMLNSNDGGGNVSTNGGATWSRQFFATAQLYHVTTTKDFPYHVCGAQQDNSTICVSSAGGGPGGFVPGTMYDVGGGESGYIAPHPTNPDIFYAGSQGALITRFDRKTGQTRDVEIYPRFFSGEPASSLPDRWQWTFPIVFSPFDPNVIYASSQFLYKTTNEGQSWQKISPDLTKADPKTLGESGGPLTHDMNGPEIYGTIFAVAHSKKEPNTIWTGSDDGLIHITRDAGKKWANITPPDLPPLIRISIIDASAHAAGTAFFCAKNYLQDDRAPYIYRTDDFGKSWKKIINGIRKDDYVHSVREDPRRANLLYAGAEHGIYISFDGGENWQSLALNLPDTQVSDIVVEDHDLVIATHGRSMWVLDNIAALRQMTPEVAQTQSLHVFTPEDGVRRARRVAIDYFLKTKVEKATIDILDAQGKVIRTFVGPPEKKIGEGAPEEQEEEDFFRGPRQRVGLDAGLNRFNWDLRYSGSTVFPGLILWGARAEQGPLAVPGAYQVRVTANGQTQTRPFALAKDPRVSATAADIKAQFDLAMQVRDKVSEANEAVINIRRIRAAMDGRISQAAKQSESAKQSVTSAGESLRKKLTDVEEALYQTRNRSGQDPLNFPIKLNNKIAHLLGVIESDADARPTDQSYASFKEMSGELAALLSKLNNTLGADLAAYNKILTDNKLESIPKDAPTK